MKNLKLTLIGLLIFCCFNLSGQISQTIIKGSNSNVIYQNFYSEGGGTLQSIKISTDRSGLLTIRLFDNEKQITSSDPMWEIKDVPKNEKGELEVDLSQGSGKTRKLDPDKQYSFSVVGAGNIHHSFLEDTYPFGNLRFEDGIERKGDLFFELQYERVETNLQKPERSQEETLLMYPNPSSQQIQFKHLKENAKITIYDSSGRKAMSAQISPQEIIDIQSLEDGKYFVVIKTTKTREVKQLIVIKP